MDCVNLVTVNWKPLELMNAGSFRKIVDPILRALSLDDRLTISADNTGKLVIQEAKQIRERIKQEMKVLHNRLVSEKQCNMETDNCNTFQAPPSESEDSAAAVVARRIAEKFSQKKDTSNECVQADDLRLQLRNFQEQEPQPEFCNVLAYWKGKKHTWPELYKLAIIELAIPATQFNVEKLFSGMRYIFSTLRGNLKADILDAILLIRCNSDMFNKNESDDEDHEIESKRMLLLED
ncbi:uncharacterized protein LOC117171129 [Belonocnema kinseyi]|uniref:uncharacterized protein LOC117171129 n=1 Tax=Belonocnema kinseyi TaxID=2817044 RepID=UPI00143D8336|nr:uncharacterized protein LOC117171129 [Belonocnema kinseyi]